MRRVQTGEHGREDSGARGEDPREMRWDRPGAFLALWQGERAQSGLALGLWKGLFPLGITGPHWVSLGIPSGQHQALVDIIKHH